MPTYVYRLRDGEVGCGDCRNGFEKFHGMSPEAALEICPACSSQVQIRILPHRIQFNAHNPIIDGCYMSSLAQKPNDPEAYVTGVDSRRRLIEKRQRQGYRILKPSEADDSTEAPVQQKRRERREEKLREKRNRPSIEIT